MRLPLRSLELTVLPAAASSRPHVCLCFLLGWILSYVCSLPGGDAALNTLKALSAGAFAGALSRTLTSPLERLKVLKQVQSHNTKYNGIFSALATMYREEGIRSYWKGNGTNVVRIAPFSAIQFVSFDFYKSIIIGDDPANAGFFKTFGSGALTGMTAATICYPLDLVRSVLSVQTTTENYKVRAQNAMRSFP